MYKSLRLFKVETDENSNDYNLIRYYFAIEKENGKHVIFFTFWGGGIGIGDQTRIIENAEDLILIGVVFLKEKENISRMMQTKFLETYK